MEISNDRRSVRIDVRGSFTAAQLETLISDIAEARSRLDPPVPLEPNKAELARDEARRIAAEENPHMQLQALQDSRIRVWLRSAGFGWIVFDLPAERAAQMRDFLTHYTKQDPSAAGNFFGDKRPGGNTAH